MYPIYYSTKTFAFNNVLGDNHIQSFHLGRYIVGYTVVYEPKIVSEYDQEIPQSQTADNPVVPRFPNVYPMIYLPK